MTINWLVFLFGFIGGALAEALKWYNLRESPIPPVYLKSGFYWVITLIMALVGGILAVAYNVDVSKPVLAINIGISAPMILKGLASIIPVKSPAGDSFAAGTQKTNVLDMVAGRIV